MLYLVRHGQSTWNRDRRLQGQCPDPELTALGREQVAAAAAVLAAEPPVDVVVSSDLLRARQSAEIVAAGRPVVPDERLREQHAGTLQGVGTDDALALLAGHDWTDPDLPLGGSGETPRQVYDRMADVLTAYRDRVAVLVSHGDAIRAALAWWCGHAPAAGPWVTVGSAAVFALDGPGTWRELTAGTTPPG